MSAIAPRSSYSTSSATGGPPDWVKFLVPPVLRQHSVRGWGLRKNAVETAARVGEDLDGPGFLLLGARDHDLLGGREHTPADVAQRERRWVHALGGLLPRHRAGGDLLG